MSHVYLSTRHVDAKDFLSSANHFSYNDKGSPILTTTLSGPHDTAYRTTIQKLRFGGTCLPAPYGMNITIFLTIRKRINS
jgi:hypothetical protein